MAYVNDNNNYQAPMLPGAVANPTPGTIVVHINAKVQVDAGGIWTSADSVARTAPNGAPGATPITSIGSGPLAAGSATSASTAQSAILGVNGTGTAKLQPQVMGVFGRLYFGGDGMATNGLRYGAAIEVREQLRAVSQTRIQQPAHQYVIGARLVGPVPGYRSVSAQA